MRQFRSDCIYSECPLALAAARCVSIMHNIIVVNSYFVCCRISGVSSVSAESSASRVFPCENSSWKLKQTGVIDWDAMPDSIDPARGGGILSVS